MTGVCRTYSTRYFERFETLSCWLDAAQVTITLVRARGLKKMDTFGSADPYVVLRCGRGSKAQCTRLGKEQHRTEIVKNSRAPTWDASFTLVASGESIDAQDGMVLVVPSPSRRTRRRPYV